VLIGLLILLLDVAAIGGLIIAIVVTAFRLRRGRLAQASVPASRRWTTLIVLMALLGLLVLGNARLLISSDNEGRIVRAQVVGTWTDSSSGSAMLRVLPDGTFRAVRLPADANDPAADGKPHPTGGHGTWQITGGGGTWYVLFTFSGGSQFRLDALDPVARRRASTAMFSYVFAQYNGVALWVFDRR
jgi:hypothetical protein